MKRIIGVLSLCFLIFSGIIMAEGNGEIGLIQGVKPISLSEAEKLMKEPNVYFFDINSDEDRSQNGYIPKSIGINVENWESLLPDDKNAILVFYGLNRFGFGASQAAAAAMELGYKNSLVMLDGIEGWITSGRITEKAGIVKWEDAKDITKFEDTIHRRLMFGKTPSCRDCHSKDNKGIRVDTAANVALINQNCASCHKEEDKAFQVSVHGPKYWKRPELRKEHQEGEEKKEKPNCNTCHPIHIAPEHSGVLSQKQISEKKCGECHKKEQETFYHSFHGKGMVLSAEGETSKVAACSDCHGKHNILNSQERDSTLSLINRAQTCGECHPNSHQNFADFLAHADHKDKENYAGLYYIYIAMTSLVVGVFLFFGAHTILWAMRLIITRIRYPKAWKEAQHAMHSDKVIVRRFSTLHRIQHFFMASSFLGLAFSGLPQKFYDASWAKPIINLIGGDIVHATFIHHISAIIMFAVFFSHIGEIIVLNWKRRDSVRNPQTGKLEFKKILKALFGPDSLMPNLQDLRDMKAHFKWFFGMGPRPQFDRWTYWEKFDYLAVFWGMFVIGFSGLVLWFPVFFSYFLPGWALNVATIFHSDEALLAIGFIFAIHFFNTHFRADRFPMDMVIFSGVITEEEMKHERNEWYKRLLQSGKLEKLYEKNSKFTSYKWLAKTIGFLMLFTGLFFLFLMVYYAISLIIGS